MPKPDGGPAFPGFGSVFTTDGAGRTLPQSAWGIEGSTGMTVRQLFAGLAMQGLLAKYGDTQDAEITATAYGHADSMLAFEAREAKKEAKAENVP